MEERFDSDGHLYSEASFLSEHEKRGARLWKEAQPRTFSLGGTTIDLSEAAERAEVALRDAKKRVIALVIRNADGAHGSHLLASTRLEESSCGELERCSAAGRQQSNVRQDMAMAGPCRTSSLTSGSGTMNDVFKTLFNGTASGLEARDSTGGSLEALRLAQAITHILECRNEQEGSAIFEQPAAELECTLRVHAFPPKDPAGAPPATVARMRYNYNAHGEFEVRHSDEREGGRMHGHTDQPGTDGVVLLNLGSCDFFFDVGKGQGVGKCQAQKTKETWCTGREGGHGHWITAADAPAERFTSHELDHPCWLLRERLCATCAAGGQGSECPRCASNTVRLRSGDLVVFSGCAAFHGVARVADEQPRPARMALPRWAQSRLDSGWRLSTQWRLTHAATARAKEVAEMGALAKSARAQGGLDEDAEIQLALELSMQEYASRQGGGQGGGQLSSTTSGASRAKPIVLDD